MVRVKQNGVYPADGKYQRGCPGDKGGLISGQCIQPDPFFFQAYFFRFTNVKYPLPTRAWQYISRWCCVQCLFLDEKYI